MEQRSNNETRKPDTMSTTEAARYLNMNHVTLWRYIKRGLVPATEERASTNTRRIYRVSVADIEAIKLRLDAGEQLFTPQFGRKPKQKRQA
jgi:hypothetical protein